MEHGYEQGTKKPNAPRKRVYHPRHPGFYAILAAAAILLWFVFRLVD